jgi:hypothetical protein
MHYLLSNLYDIIISVIRQVIASTANEGVANARRQGRTLENALRTRRK